MLEIHTLTYNGQMPVAPITGTISGNEGTIGRAMGNTIVLPDPFNMVSRQHLRFSLQPDEAYKVVNVSDENVVFVNEKELRSGMEFLLEDCDKISVAGYVLEVRYLKRDTANSLPVSTVGAPRIKKMSNDFLMSLSECDTETGFASEIPEETRRENDDLLDSLMQQESKPIQGDPTKMFKKHTVELSSLDSKNDGLINAMGGAGTQLHELLRDPLSGSVQQFHRDDFNDPLRSMESESGDSFVDVFQVNNKVDVNINSIHINVANGSELGGLFHLPSSDLSSVLHSATEAQASDFGKRAQKTLVENAPVSDKNPSGEIADIDQFISGFLVPPPSARDDAPLQPAVVSAQEEQHQISKIMVESVDSARLPVLTDVCISEDTENVPPMADSLRKSILDEINNLETKVSQEEAEKLYQAFIEGLGVDIPNRTALDEDFMNLLGQLLRNYTQGALKMIADRALIKQEVRADITVIAPDHNNPLKFSPNNETAMLYLLGESPPGFMKSVEAIQNAFDDLCAHQIGLVSGVKTALAHVLENFDPASIAGAKKRKGLLYKILPLWRDARLWKEYVRHYRFTRESAKDHFHDFCGFVFLKAYMEAVSLAESGSANTKDEKRG